MDITPGARLALLMLDGFEHAVAEVVAELARRGHPGVTATHEFALRAVDGGARDASSLGRSLGVSKQAAAKTIEALERMDYVERTDDPSDARRRRLHVTDRGREMTSIGGDAFTRLRDQLAERLGPGGIEQLESALAQVTGLTIDR